MQGERKGNESYCEWVDKGGQILREFIGIWVLYKFWVWVYSVYMIICYVVFRLQGMEVGGILCEVWKVKELFYL